MRSRQSSVGPVFFSILGTLLILAVAGLGFLFLTTSADLDEEKQRNQELSAQVAELEERLPVNPQEELAEVVAQVSEVYELPTNEEPTLVTVDDVEQLTGQAFFERAENGDKLLIYNESKQAFLFRPSSGKVINSGPIAITGDQQLEPSPDTPNTEE